MAFCIVVTSPQPHSRQLWGEQSVFWMWLLGTNMGSKNLVLQIPGLCALNSYSCFWLLRGQHRGWLLFQSSQMEIVPREFKEIVLVRSFPPFGTRHWKKFLSGHWLTIEIMERKLQWPHSTKNTHFGNKFWKSHKWKSTTLKQARLGDLWGMEELNLQSFNNIILQMSSSHQKLQNIPKNRKV